MPYDQAEQCRKESRVNEKDQAPLAGIPASSPLDPQAAWNRFWELRQQTSIPDDFLTDREQAPLSPDPFA